MYGYDALKVLSLMRESRVMLEPPPIEVVVLDLRSDGHVHHHVIIAHARSMTHGE